MQAEFKLFVYLYKYKTCYFGFHITKNIIDCKKQ